MIVLTISKMLRPVEVCVLFCFFSCQYITELIVLNYWACFVGPILLVHNAIFVPPQIAMAVFIEHEVLSSGHSSHC